MCILELLCQHISSLTNNHSVIAYSGKTYGIIADLLIGKTLSGILRFADIVKHVLQTIPVSKRFSHK